MNVIFVILFLFSLIKSNNNPSDNIWEKVLSAINNGTLILPNNKRHFIYDEKNYLKEEKNSSKMLSLYQKQEDVYLFNDISNYIFFVQNLEEDKESLESCAKNLIALISKEFGFSLSKSIIILFSMDTRRIRIQPGNSLETLFTYSISSLMITNLQSLMRREDYYGALIQFIEDVNNIYYRQYPSNVIWAKTLYSIKNGETMISSNKTHFIYDEKNYIKDGNDSSRMKFLYQMQEDIFFNNNIKNYIFLVDNIYDTYEALNTFTNKIYNFIYKEFGFTLQNSIIAIFCIKSNLVKLKLGNDLQIYFIENIYNKMIENIKIYTKNSNYFNALIKLIEDIDYYYNKIFPSNIFWEKVINASERGEMIIPINKAHFLYDEQNFLKEEVNSARMQILYEKQEELYLNNSIKNYIFLIRNIDEQEEDLKMFSQKLIILISNYFISSPNKSIIALFLMNSKRIQIQPGDDIKSVFTSYACNNIADKLKDYMKNDGYYKIYDAMIKLIHDIDYYYNHGELPKEPFFFTIPFLIGILSFGTIFFCLALE